MRSDHAQSRRQLIRCPENWGADPYPRKSERRDGEGIVRRWWGRFGDVCQCQRSGLCPCKHPYPVYEHNQSWIMTVNCYDAFVIGSDEVCAVSVCMFPTSVHIGHNISFIILRDTMIPKPHMRIVLAPSIMFCTYGAACYVVGFQGAWADTFIEPPFNLAGTPHPQGIIDRSIGS